MVEWRRLQREVAKAMLGGSAGGLAATTVSFSFSGELEESVGIILLFWLIVVSYAMFEYLFPPEEDGNSQTSTKSDHQENEERPYEDVFYAS